MAVVLAASLFLGVLAVWAIANDWADGRGASTADTPAARCHLGAPWRCSTVEVPQSVAPDGVTTRTIDVLYAVRPADAPVPGGARRVLVLVSGGPGSSGIEDADWSFEALDPRITRRFDVVAFDARGTGGTDPHACPAAGRRYSRAPVTAETASAFAVDCVREADVAPEELAGFSSRTIAEDIDAIRAALGVERITVYGSSYGTVITQAYAAAHPDRLDGIVLDAPIDRSAQAADLWVTAAEGFRTALDLTFAACEADPDCDDALPSPAGSIERVYDELAANGTLTATVTGTDGEGHSESMTRADFEAVVTSTMYDVTTRIHLLRALQAAGAGDRRQLLRLVDVEGGEGHAASFAYFATWCGDARASPSARTDDFEAFTQPGRRAKLPAASLEIAWTLAPCLYWPGQQATWAPPAESTTVPMLILSSTADPITPISEARAILARHPEARLVETQGGAHGSLGDACPGDRVADFIVDGRLPVGSTSICSGSAIDTFVPIAPSPARSADDAALGVLWEILGAPEVSAWDGADDLTLGCADAGTMRLSLADAGDRVDISLDGCAWASGATFDGSGWLDLYTWDADLQLASSRGGLRLTTRGERWTLVGTWDGSTVSRRE
jgi:pimeloyl-ACP methyl ester carboxylesterase